MPDAAEMFCLGVGTGDNDIISLCSVEMLPFLLPFDRQCLIGLSELDGPGVKVGDCCGASGFNFIAI
ncbi:hypothetical protein D3C80_1916420 [compost metagenome]